MVAGCTFQRVSLVPVLGVPVSSGMSTFRRQWMGRASLRPRFSYGEVPGWRCGANVAARPASGCGTTSAPGPETSRGRAEITNSLVIGVITHTHTQKGQTKDQNRQTHYAPRLFQSITPSTVYRSCSHSFALVKWLFPKNPRLADSGLGCADLSTWWRFCRQLSLRQACSGTYSVEPRNHLGSVCAPRHDDDAVGAGRLVRARQAVSHHLEHGRRELLPSLVGVRASLVRADGERGVEQEHAVLGPLGQVAVVSFIDKAAAHPCVGATKPGNSVPICL